MVLELQATIMQSGLTVAVALLGALAGYAVASIRRPSAQDADAAARHAAAVTSLRGAMAACDGPRRRLLRVADAATATADALTHCHELGMVEVSRSINPDWPPPHELHREGPRLPVTAWQGFDRAFEALMATLDDPDANLPTQAHVFTEFATAARQVADALIQPEFSAALARCMFCGQHGTDVRKLISSPYALICDQCIRLCVEVLEDEIDPDWRSDTPE